MRKVLLLLGIVVLGFVSLGQQSGVQARVVAAELNVRDGYAPESTIIGALPVNALVNVVGREDIADNGGIWMYISATDRDLSGWVLSYYLEFDDDFILSMVPMMNDDATQTTTDEQAVVQEPAAPTGDGMSGSTTAIINLRSGPGTRFDVLDILPADLPVVFTARNQSSTWLQAVVNGRTGWLSYTFIRAEGDVSTLPVVGATVTDNAPSQTSNEQAQASPIPGVVPQVGGTARDIYLRGLELGNNPGVFSKIGDSITASNLFLDPIGHGGAQLGEYAYLQDVIQFFSQVSARDHYSFANTSLAARGGWSTLDVLSIERAVPGICQPGENPLECEYRVNRPAVALIMLGTNDVGWMDSNQYRANMERIVQVSIDRGVIPVLSTIPDQPFNYSAGRIGEFNQIIIAIAREYGIPLWNYWLALQDLPNLGLAGDGVHPSYDTNSRETGIFTPEGLRYGYNMRNLTALMVLDAVWRGAMY